MMIGRPPFMDKDPYNIFKKVINEKIKFTRDFDPEAKDLIKKLCHHDLSKRLGNLLINPLGKNHTWLCSMK
jgi:hypothetical protein